MSGFKFDKNNEELDLSLGSDDGVVSKKPATKPAAAPKSQLPAPSIPTGKPAPAPKTTPAPAKPVAKPVTPPAKPVAKPTTPTPSPTPVVASTPVVTPPVAKPEVPVAAPAEPTAPVAPIVQPSQARIEQPIQVPIEQPPVETQQPYVPQTNPLVNPNISVPTTPPVVPPTQPPVQTEMKRPRKKAGSSFSGNRKAVLAVRIGVGVVGGAIVLAGLNSIFFPVNFPSPAAVISKVKESLNVTDFPTVKATGFVIDFTQTYFTVNPASTTNRNDQLTKYMSSAVLEQTNMTFSMPSNGSTAPTGQTLLTPPAIVNIVSVDNNNAVYTVQVNLSTGSTLYVDVPIYWNPETNGMAVSAPLSLMPTIGLTTVPQENHAITWSNDKEVSDSFEADLKKYLEAWAASDTTSINRYTTDKATIVAKLGLGGSVTLSRLDKLEVEGVSKETVDPKVRQAKINVTWADAKVPTVTYKQSYLLTIKQKPDNKWYVDNIDTTIVK